MMQNKERDKVAFKGVMKNMLPGWAFEVELSEKELEVSYLAAIIRWAVVGGAGGSTSRGRS